MIGDQAEKLREQALAGNPVRAAVGQLATTKKCRIFAVSSGKGGVGKTSLVVNLGLALIRLGFRVLVIDADLGLANIDVLVNVASRFNLADVIEGKKSIGDVIVRGPLDLRIVSGGSGLFDLANLDLARRQILIEQLKNLESEGDFILIDTSAGISRNVMGFIGAADELILVTTPEPTALTDAYGMLKVIAEKGLQQKCSVVVNVTRSPHQGRSTYASLSRVAGRYLPAMKLSYLGAIDYDPAVNSAVHDFNPFVIGRPRSAAAAAVGRIAWRIAAEADSKRDRKEGPDDFIKRFQEISCD